MSQRELALGKYEMAKKRIRELGIRAGSHLQTLRETTDTLLTNKDFTQIDFDECMILVKSLKGIQTAAKEVLKEMSELENTYGFNDR